MKTITINSGTSKYSVIAAVYQPDQGQLRRTLGLVVLLLVVFLLSLATRAHADEQSASCPVHQGGVCRPALPAAPVIVPVEVLATLATERS